MKDHVTLTISSLLSIVLFSLHWAHEVARGLEAGTVSAAGGLVILAVWLCATLVFADSVVLSMLALWKTWRVRRPLVAGLKGIIPAVPALPGRP